MKCFHRQGMTHSIYKIDNPATIDLCETVGGSKQQHELYDCIPQYFTASGNQFSDVAHPVAGWDLAVTVRPPKLLIALGFWYEYWGVCRLRISPFERYSLRKSTIRDF